MRSVQYVSIGLALVGAALAACSSGGEAESRDRCTPAAYVFCRCEDRSEGTKQCKEDGRSFEACKCDGSGKDPGEPGSSQGPSGQLEEVDAGPPPSGPMIDLACADKLGVIAGADDDSYTYVMTYKGNGAFNAAKAHPGMRSSATIVPVGGNLLAAYSGTFSSILWTKMSASTWSAPFSVGSATATSAPAMAAWNGGALLFYLGQDDRYHMGTYGAGGWDDATALGEPAAGTASMPGKSAPAAAAISTSVVVSFAGNDGTLARETYSSSTWSTLGKFNNASAFPSQPSMVALDAGGASDLLMVYTGSDLVLHGVTRTSTGHVWGAPVVVDTAATPASTASETTLVAMPGGRAMLLYRATNNRGYYSVWDPQTGFAPPKEMLAGKNPELASAPAATRGHCGSDVTVAYAKVNGGVEILRYGGTAWSGPYAVGGITKATFVGVGELP